MACGPNNTTWFAVKKVKFEVEKTNPVKQKTSDKMVKL